MKVLNAVPGAEPEPGPPETAWSSAQLPGPGFGGLLWDRGEGAAAPDKLHDIG